MSHLGQKNPTNNGKNPNVPCGVFLDRRFGNPVMLLAYSPSYGSLLVEPGSFPCQASEFGYRMAWDTLTAKLLKSDAPGHWFPSLSCQLSVSSSH